MTTPPILFLTCLLLILSVNAQSPSPSSLPTPSPPLASSLPTSVHNLRPQDIALVWAMGDSVTAAFGANDEPVEARGLSWAMGGDDEAITLPNLFKKFNPSVVGASKGWHALELHGWPHREQDSLNAAQSQAVVDDMPSQLDFLLSQFKAMGIEPAETWKLGTVFIGANDMCKACDSQLTVEAYADLYIKKLNATLLSIQSKLSPSFVNIGMFPSFEDIYNINQNKTYCRYAHKIIWECTCLFKRDDAGRAYLYSLTDAVNNAVYQLGQDWAVGTKADDIFTVVVQPFARHSHVPSIDYVSSVDCFHPGSKLQKAMAIGLWDNILTPVGKKDETWVPDRAPLEPFLNSTLATGWNSREETTRLRRRF